MENGDVSIEIVDLSIENGNFPIDLPIYIQYFIVDLAIEKCDLSIVVCKRLPKGMVCKYEIMGGFLMETSWVSNGDLPGNECLIFYGYIVILCSSG